MNYNTDKTLWENYLKNITKAGRVQEFEVWEGMVSDGITVRARFADQVEALKTLSEAGWIIISPKAKGLPHKARNK